MNKKHSAAALVMSGIGLIGLLVAESAVQAVQAVQAAPYTTHSSPKVGTVYAYNLAADTDQGSITEYAKTANGNAKPSVSISGSKTSMASGSTTSALAVSPKGDVFVITESPSIVEFAPGATGNAKPTTVISGSNTGLVEPTAIAVSSSGDIWVANASTSLLEFAPGAKGNAKPIDTISGSSTGIGTVPAIALTANGKDIWISTQFSPHALEEFSTSAKGNVKPVATISGSKTGLASGVNAWGLAVLSNGSVAATETNTSTGGTSIVEFAAGKHGNVAPSRKISGKNTGLTTGADDIFAMAVGTSGRFWVSDDSSGLHSVYKLLEFSNTQSGNAKPVADITGSKTGLSFPTGIGVYLG